MDLSGLRIGYSPLSRDCTHPGDRRRFCAWARRRGLAFEIAESRRPYELVVLTQRCDLSVWSAYPQGQARLLFDFPDSYLQVSRSDPKGLLRGLANYLAGRSRALRLNHWEALRSMCRRADAVVCSTEEQKEEIIALCPNSHIILDVQDMGSSLKTDYSCGETFNLVWEGLAENLHPFAKLSPVLRRLAAERPLALHLVTDLEYRPFLGAYGRRRTLDAARRFFEPVYLYQWHAATAARIMTACDLAVIPMDLGNSLSAGKSLNKLLLFWRLGIPAVVSATPTYARAMNESGQELACRGLEQWERALRRCRADEALRRDAAERGRRFALSRFAEEAVLSAWDRAVESALAGR